MFKEFTVDPSPSRLAVNSTNNDQVRRSPRLAARPSPKPRSPLRNITINRSPSRQNDPSPTKKLPEDDQSKSNSESDLGASGGGQTQPLELIVDGVSSYAVVPLTWCPHLLEINAAPDLTRVQAHQSCSRCQDRSENWICLTCLGVFCSRYVRGHMAEHFDATVHPMTLSFSDLSVWCYVCDSYVDNDLLVAFKEAAYASKFSS